MRIIKIIMPVLILAVAIGIVALLVIGKPQAQKTNDNQQIAALVVAPARMENVTLAVDSQGEVRAKTDVQIVPEVGGRITWIAPFFAQGGAFKSNAVLARIDDAQYKLAVIRAEARVAEARVVLERQLADARIKEKQWKNYGLDGAPTALALNKPQVAEAQAKLRSATADLEEAKLNLARTKITMPFDGRVSQRSVGLGQFVTPGTVLGQAFATDMVEIRLPLTDRQVGELDLPLAFEETTDLPPMPVTLKATFAGRPRQWSARLVRMQASVDAQTRLFYAIAEMKNPYEPAIGEAPLPVGLFVTAEIENPHSRQAIVIPRTGLRGDNQVFTIADNRLRIRRVSVLATDSDNAILLDGIEVGTNVVISPVRSPRDGMTVQIANRGAIESATAPQATASDTAAIDTAAIDTAASDTGAEDTAADAPATGEASQTTSR